MSDQKVGAQLDALGVTLDLDDHQHIADVVIVARLGDATDGVTALVLGASEGCDWIGQMGLLAAARTVVAWCIVAIIGGLLVGRSIRLSRAPDPPPRDPP